MRAGAATDIAWQTRPIWRRLGMSSGLAVLALAYLPIVWLMVMSFSARPLSGVPYPLTLEWYLRMAADTRWRAPMVSSIVIAVLVGIACALIGTFVGRGVMRLKRPGWVLGTALLPLFVPGLTIGAALFLFLRLDLGLRLGPWSVALGHVLWALPFALLLVVVMLTRFDRRLIDAARDLGASPYQVFWLVEWPLLRPAIIGAAMFGFFLSFSELPRSLFLRGTSTTMPIFQWAQASDHQSYVPISFALATIIVVVTIPLLAVFFFIAFRPAASRS
ncbi:MAG: ABC transporter permease subunit [Bauldia sp.]|uniref:ABC transporter permease n=1 Tax=Bauldia sp. TaxID=2575872 RepID=UPI001D5B0A6B|nr:ABC transporter permease subunit [Bauldia sp.]MCB1497511.1 ABC transporter permease subunit [Bauldia sp.]